MQYHPRALTAAGMLFERARGTQYQVVRIRRQMVGKPSLNIEGKNIVRITLQRIAECGESDETVKQMKAVCPFAGNVQKQIQFRRRVFGNGLKHYCTDTALLLSATTGCLARDSLSAKPSLSLRSMAAASLGSGENVSERSHW